jgi:hypothetical protein
MLSLAQNITLFLIAIILMVEIPAVKRLILILLVANLISS